MSAQKWSPPKPEDAEWEWRGLGLGLRQTSCACNATRMKSKAARLKTPFSGLLLTSPKGRASRFFSSYFPAVHRGLQESAFGLPSPFPSAVDGEAAVCAWLHPLCPGGSHECFTQQHSAVQESPSLLSTNRDYRDLGGALAHWSEETWREPSLAKPRLPCCKAVQLSPPAA